MLAHPELDYNPQPLQRHGRRNQRVADQRSSDRPLRNWLNTTASCSLLGAGTPSTQLAQVINGFRDTYGLSVIPVSVDGVINPLLPDSRTDQAGAAPRCEIFPAMMLVDPKQGSVLARYQYGFISQDDSAKQFLNVSEDFKPTLTKGYICIQGFVFLQVPACLSWGLLVISLQDQ